jgi:anti-sigma B factor antagonist
MALEALSADSFRLPDGAGVRLLGELDIATVPLADEAIRAAEVGGPARLVIDLSGLAFMDSTGLRMVMAAAARAREEGRRLAVVPGPDAVQRVFELTGMDGRLEFVARS